MDCGLPRSERFGERGDELADFADDIGPGPVDCLRQAPHDRAADDQAVGNRGELADLVGTADPEADADRQLGLGAQPGDGFDDIGGQGSFVRR